MGRKRIKPLDPIKAAGIAPGTVLENPDDGSTYVVGQRGRRPPWVIGVVCKGLGKAQKAPVVGKDSKSGKMLVSGPGCFVVDGATLSLSGDAEIELDINSQVVKIG